MPKRARPYKTGLLQRLKNPSYAVEYLKAAAELSDDVAFCLAVCDIAEAWGAVQFPSTPQASREGSQGGTNA